MYLYRSCYSSSNRDWLSMQPKWKVEMPHWISCCVQWGSVCILVFVSLFFHTLYQESSNQARVKPTDRRQPILRSANNRFCTAFLSKILMSAWGSFGTKVATMLGSQPPIGRNCLDSTNEARPWESILYVCMWPGGKGSIATPSVRGNSRSPLTSEHMANVPAEKVRPVASALMFP